MKNPLFVSFHPSVVQISVCVLTDVVLLLQAGAAGAREAGAREAGARATGAREAGEREAGKRETSCCRSEPSSAPALPLPLASDWSRVGC